MKLIIIFLSLLIYLTNPTHPRSLPNPQHRRCASEEQNPDHVNYGISQSFLEPMTRFITVYFHVINNGNSVANGNITENQINSQISVLNLAYATSGFQFVVGSIDRTMNGKWFGAGKGSYEETAMKNKLRKGGAGDLNLYTNIFWDGLLGWATFPADYKKNKKNDGVVCLFSTLPGGSTINFNTGYTVVHEVGHWLGLYHTFNGGCSYPGDYVDDTPAELAPASGCPIGRNTCPEPNFPGFDPVTNYMDYSDDSCLDTFTNGQITRMQAQWKIYRNSTS